MFNLLAIGWEHYAFTIPLSVLSVFLILVILVQRGRGGGLTGALGGMGGQSAFGTKAGDLFTRITVGVAAVWILLSMAALKMLNITGTTLNASPPPATGPVQGGTTTDTPAVVPATKGTTKPAASTKAPATGVGAATDGAASKATPSKAPASTAPKSKTSE